MKLKHFSQRYAQGSVLIWTITAVAVVAVLATAAYAMKVEQRKDDVAVRAR